MSTVTLNPKLFNLLLTKGHIVSKNGAIYTEQDGKRLRVVVCTAQELEELHV